MGKVRTGLRIAAALGLAAQMAACGSVPRTAYTAREAADATVPGIPDARVFADASFDTIARLSSVPQRKQDRFTYLALSGGGEMAPMARAC